MKIKNILPNDTQRHRNIFSFLLGVFCCLLLMISCKEPETTQQQNQTKYNRDHWTSLKPKVQTQARLSPHDGRQARRISIAQLRKSIPQLFDGMTWTENNNNMFDRLSRTLGEADYIYLTATNYEITPLFMKFMDDMASSLCHRAVNRDFSNTNSKKLIVIDERDIDKTLRFLRLKFHNLHIPENETKGITAYRSFYDKVMFRTKDRKQAWQSVCILMLTAPEFMVY